MSAAATSSLWGGRAYAQKWNLSSLRAQRQHLSDASSSDLLRLLMSLAHLRPTLYEEMAEEINAILDYCCNDGADNCTQWVRATAAILRAGGNNGSRFGSPPMGSSAGGGDAADEVVESLVRKMVDAADRTALSSSSLRRFQPHESAYLDACVLPAALQLPAISTSLADSKAAATNDATKQTSSDSLNPHCTVRCAISFDIVIPKEEESERISAPSLSHVASATAPSSSSHSSSRPAAPRSLAKPMPSSSLFASKPLSRPPNGGPAVLGAGASAALAAISGFQKRPVIQMLDINEAHAAMDTSKRRKTSSMVLAPTAASVEESRRLKEEKERDRQEAKEAKLREKEARDAEKKAALEAKQKEKEDRAAAKLEKDRLREEEKERARAEKERLREEKERIKEEKEKEREEKKRLAQINQQKKASPTVPPASTPSSTQIDGRPVPAMLPGANLPSAAVTMPLPPALMQALVASPQDPTTMAMFAAWQANNQQTGPPTPQQVPPPQQQFYFSPSGLGPAAATSFPYPINYQMGGGMIGLHSPMMAATVAAITAPTQLGMSLAQAQANAALAHADAQAASEAQATVTAAASALSAALAAASAQSAPSPSVASTGSSSVASPPAASPAAAAAAPTPAAAAPTVTAGLDSILAKSNRVTPEEREMIVKFLNHQPFPPPAGTVNGVYQIVLNEDSDVPDPKGGVAKETTIFEMTFANWSWRKVKKRKTKTKGGKKAAANATTGNTTTTATTEADKATSITPAPAPPAQAPAAAAQHTDMDTN